MTTLTSLDPVTVKAAQAAADEVAADLEQILPGLRVLVDRILELRAYSDTAEQQLLELLPADAGLHARDGVIAFALSAFCTPRLDDAVIELEGIVSDLE